MFRNDTGTVVAWQLNSAEGSELYFATGDRRKLKGQESVACEWSGQFCAIRWFSWPEKKARTEVVWTNGPHAPVVTAPFWIDTMFLKERLLYLCGRPSERVVTCQIFNIESYQWIRDFRVSGADWAMDIDPWSDTMLLNERVSDHPPRNRWLLTEVNSGKVHDLGSSARWVFFLKEDLVARALEVAP